MPPMTPADVHKDRPLTNFLVAHPLNQYGYDRIWPVVNVKFESDDYYRIYPSHRIVKDTRRSPGATSTRVDFAYTTDSYASHEYAAHEIVPHRVMNNADDPLSPAEDAALTSKEAVRLDLERFVTGLQFASTLPKGSPTAKFNAADLSTVKLAKDIFTAKEAVRKKLGIQPNGIAFSSAVASAIAIWLLEQKNGAGVEFSSIEQFLAAGTLPPKIWNLEVIELGAVKSTAKRPESVAAANTEDVVGDNVLVFFKNPTPGLRRISFGYTFRVIGSEMARRGTFEGPRRADWIEYCSAEAHKLVSTDCVYMIEDVLV